jgi:hypothetical protein
MGRNTTSCPLPISEHSLQDGFLGIQEPSHVPSKEKRNNEWVQSHRSIPRTEVHSCIATESSCDARVSISVEREDTLASTLKCKSGSKVLSDFATRDVRS